MIKFLQRCLPPLMLMLACASAHAAQNVGGLSIEYGPGFQSNPEKAIKWKANFPPDFQAQLESFEIFEAPASLGIHEIRLLKSKFREPIPYSVDGAAEAVITNLNGMPGVKKPTHTIVPVAIRGLEARHMSFNASRFNGRVGGEFLSLFNKKNSTAYQLQIFFVKKESLNPFNSELTLDAERLQALQILKSVSLYNR